jgi:hypothetical protein
MLQLVTASEARPVRVDASGKPRAFTCLPFLWSNLKGTNTSMARSKIVRAKDGGAAKTFKQGETN